MELSETKSLDTQLFQMFASDLIKMGRDTKKLKNNGIENVPELELIDNYENKFSIGFHIETNSWIINDGFVKTKFNPTISDLKLFLKDFNTENTIIQLVKLRKEFENLLNHEIS